MKKTFSVIVLILIFSSVASARRDSRPLENEGKDGLRAKSLDQVLRLNEN